MTALTVLFLAAGGLFAAGAWWARSGRAAVLLFAAFAVLYVGGAEMLSRPKPAALELLHRFEHRPSEVLSFMFRENEAIYLWVMLPGEREPRAYRIAWDKRLAEKLQAARDAAGQQGTITMMLPFQRSWEKREPMAPHPIPVPKLPDKFGAPPPEPGRGA